MRPRPRSEGNRRSRRSPARELRPGPEDTPNRNGSVRSCSEHTHKLDDSVRSSAEDTSTRNCSVRLGPVDTHKRNDSSRPAEDSTRNSVEMRIVRLNHRGYSRGCRQIKDCPVTKPARCRFHPSANPSWFSQLSNPDHQQCDVNYIEIRRAKGIGYRRVLRIS